MVLEATHCELPVDLSGMTLHTSWGHSPPRTVGSLVVVNFLLNMVTCCDTPSPSIVPSAANLVWVFFDLEYHHLNQLWDAGILGDISELTVSCVLGEYLW